MNVWRLFKYEGEIKCHISDYDTKAEADLDKGRFESSLPGNYGVEGCARINFQEPPWSVAVKTEDRETSRSNGLPVGAVGNLKRSEGFPSPEGVSVNGDPGPTNTP